MKLISRYSLILSLLLIYFAGILAYSNSFAGAFVFDDQNTIMAQRQLRRVTDARSFYNAFRTRYIPYLTLALNYKISKMDPTGYHVVNFIIHILNSFSVFFLIGIIQKTPALVKVKTGNSKLLPFATALIFTIHPVQTEAVSFISQRFTLLACLFYLLTLIFYLYYRLAKDGGGIIYYFISLFSLILALFSKENCYTLPVIILLIEIILFKNKIISDAKTAFKYLPFLIIPAFVFMIIFAGSGTGPLGTVAKLNMLQSARISRSEYFLSELKVIRKYTELMFFPLNQNIDYDFPTNRSLFEKEVIISVIFIALVLLAALKLRKKEILFTFGIFFFFITLAIESSFIPIKDLIFEHRLYLPSFGLILATTSLLYKLRKNYFLILLFFMTLILVFLTFNRNKVWSNEYSLWKDTIIKSPHKARPHYNLGVAAFEKGNKDEAKKEFLNTIAIDPKYYDAYRNLAEIYRQEGNNPQSYKLLTETISKYPDIPGLKSSLASIYAKNGDYTASVLEYKLLLNDNPDNASVYNDLGVVYFMAGNPGQAIISYQKAFSLKPDYENAILNLANIYYHLGNDVLAKKYYLLLVNINPENSQAIGILKKFKESESE